MKKKKTNLSAAFPGGITVGEGAHLQKVDIEDKDLVFIVGGRKYVIAQSGIPTDPTEPPVEPPEPPDPDEQVTVFYHKFEDSPLTDAYGKDDVQRDFGDFRYSNGLDNGNCKIIEFDGTRVLKVTNKAGEIGADAGCQFNKELTEGQRRELWMSYNISFDPNFVPVLGGKLPGMMTCSSNPDTHPQGGGGEGFSNRVMWKEENSLNHYLYWPEQTANWGQHVGGRWPDPQDPSKDFSFQHDDFVKHNITMRVCINNPGARDGFMEAFIDGKFVQRVDDLRLTTNPDRLIDEMSITYFYGGSTYDWAPPVDTSIYLYDAHLWYIEDQIEVRSEEGRDISAYLKNFT